MESKYSLDKLIIHNNKLESTKNILKYDSWTIYKNHATIDFLKRNIYAQFLDTQNSFKMICYIKRTTPFLVVNVWRLTLYINT